MTELTLASLAQSTGAELRGNGGTVIRSVATLDDAGPGDISFLSNERYRHQLADTKASAVILQAEFRDVCKTNALVTDSPYLVYAKVSALLHPEPEAVAGCHPSAVVSPSAKIHPTAEIGPLCFVDDGVEIGEKVVLGPGCVVLSGTSVGDETRLVARVTLCDGIRIGRRCLLHPGVVVGGDGFGMADDNGRWTKVPQLGKVVIGDDVEIGSNTTIDRGSLRDTLVSNGVKIDNLVMVAHNVQLGEHTAVAGCTGIAGSTTVGKHCMLAGNTGLAGHLDIGDKVYVSGKSLVTRSLKGPGSYSGNLPALPTTAWRRMVVRLRQLDDLFQRVKNLELRLGK